MTIELYKRMRPTEFSQVFGQSDVCRDLEKALEKKRLPHTILFTGPSGTGKTTIARILKEKVGCGKNELFEYDCADARGIDEIRGIKNLTSAATLGGRSRVFIIDECHAITKDGQNAFLKTLEDTPKHIYFFLCTTDPQKLLPTIRTRATTYSLKLISVDDLMEMMMSICKKDEIKIKPVVLQGVALAAAGSARTALVILDQIRDIPSLKEQIAAIAIASCKTAGIEIARAVFNPRTTWKDLAALLKTTEEEPERLRLAIRGYAAAVLLNGKTDLRAWAILEEFHEPYYDNQKTGLVESCFAICQRK